jgi:MoaA/NifB/PqqE/SkfB family radical SAM enzyme
MCNIWKIPKEVPNLQVSDWLRLLSSDLFSDLRELDITGGEPFLVKDLADFFSRICELKRDHLKNLKSIAITTNGFLTARILECAERILPDLARAGLELVVVCAMDAVGEIHDQIRNYKDGWVKVNETIQGLRRLRAEFSNLVVGLKITVLPVNVDQLHNIQQYADSNGLFTIISPCIITDARYLNPDRAKDLIFCPEDIRKMRAFYQGDNFRWSYHRDALEVYFRTGEMQKPCSCGFNYFFVRSNGEVLLCPLISDSIGNVKERPIEDLFSSEMANRLRRKLGKLPECRECTEPGLERYALPYEGFTYLSLLLKMGKANFLQLHHHMGLNKYFGRA